MYSAIRDSCRPGRFPCSKLLGLCEKANKLRKQSPKSSNKLEIHSQYPPPAQTELPLHLSNTQDPPHLLHLPYLSKIFKNMFCLGSKVGSLVAAFELLGFPGGAGGNEHTCYCRRHKLRWFDPRAGKIPWKGAWLPTPVFLPRESYGQRSLASYSP